MCPSIVLLQTPLRMSHCRRPPGTTASRGNYAARAAAPTRQLRGARTVLTVLSSDAVTTSLARIAAADRGGAGPARPIGPKSPDANSPRSRPPTRPSRGAAKRTAQVFARTARLRAARLIPRTDGRRSVRIRRRRRAPCALRKWEKAKCEKAKWERVKWEKTRQRRRTDGVDGRRVLCEREHAPPARRAVPQLGLRV